MRCVARVAGVLLFAFTTCVSAKESPQVKPEKALPREFSSVAKKPETAAAGRVIALRYPAGVDPAVMDSVARSYAGTRSFPGSYTCVDDGYADKQSLTAAIARSVYFSYDVFIKLREAYPTSTVVLSPGRIVENANHELALQTEAPPADVYVDFFAFEHPCNDQYQGASTRGRRVLPIVAVSIEEKTGTFRTLSATNNLTPLLGASKGARPDVSLLLNASEIAYMAMTQEPGVKKSLPNPEYIRLWGELPSSVKPEFSAGALQRIPWSSFEVIERPDQRWEIGSEFYSVLSRSVDTALSLVSQGAGVPVLASTLAVYDPSTPLGALAPHKMQVLRSIREAELAFATNLYEKSITEYALGSSGQKMSQLLKDEAGMDRDKK